MKLNQTMCRITIPARERILAAGGYVGPGVNGCWAVPSHLSAVRIEDATGLGLVYVHTPADWDPSGHLTPALRLDSEPAYPRETHTQPL